MNYNYYEAIFDDVKAWIDENINLSDYEDRDDLERFLNDTLFLEDSVTGNTSGSYFCNTYKAEEAICHNLDILAEAVEEFGGNMDVLKDGAEACDVTIRCYLLVSVISDVLDDIYEG